jgi:hypothetical protein
MRTSPVLGCTRVSVRFGRCLVIVGAWLSFAAVSPGHATGRWPGVEIADLLTDVAVHGALDRAVSWLEAGGCEPLVEEFRDLYGRTLRDRLADLHVTCEHYLSWIAFRDGSSLRRCTAGSTLAVTAPGSRVVFVCGRTFRRTWAEDPTLATAAIIHEALHTLGLGENPPTSQFITERVLALCGKHTSN